MVALYVCAMSPPHITIDTDQIASEHGGVFTSLGRVFQVLTRPEMRRWRPIMGGALALTLVAKVFAVASPFLLGAAINAVVGGDASDGFMLAAGLLAAFVGARFLSTAFPQVRDAMFAPVSQDAQRIVSVDAFASAQNLSMAFHQTRRTGALNRIIERGASAIDYLLRFLAFNIGPTLVELMLAAIALAAVYDWRLSVVAIVTVFAYGVWTYALTEWRVQQRRRMNEADTELRAKSVDSLTNFETVKAFAAEARETHRFDRAMKTYNRRYVTAMRSLALLNAGQEFIMNAGLLAMTSLAAWKVYQGELEVGAIAAVFAVLMNIYRPLNILGWAWREIKQGSVDLEKVYGLMGMTPDVTDPASPQTIETPEGRVRFDAVTYAHAGRETGLSDIRFEAAPGARIALVGPSGSGKSTLLKLLFRFYDVQKGAITLDGVDVRELAQADLRARLGLVPQDVVLFNDTIRQNIAYGKPDATEEELEDAARRAQLGTFIARLPDGWDTLVGERGVKLSGGERQRVGIARVILTNPSVLVLDEATSALDSGTEALVQAALDEAAKGRTTLTVAHRLSTIIQADEILVLDDGQIVERGRHGDLLASGGVYAEMWARQADSAVMSPQTVTEQS